MVERHAPAFCLCFHFAGVDKTELRLCLTQAAHADRDALAAYDLIKPLLDKDLSQAAQVLV
jgi:hypothetical protein